MEKSSNGERVGPLSTANNFHGRKLEMNRASISELKNSHFHEEFTVNKLKEANSSSGQEKAPEELELFHANKAVKDLVFKIEQSNARVKAQKLELQSLTNGGEDPQHEELAQNLDDLKRELSKLKIDVSLALESKARALNDIEVCNQKTSSSLKRAEELRKEIEEASEEHVLVELARIEAEKELREIESQRAAEAMEFSNQMEAAKKRISELRREISGAKELEEKLAAINTDVSVLQNEMELIRAMDKKSGDREQLKIVENELRKAKKEQGSIKEEGFRFMASMDLVRVELLQISEETNGMKKLEKNTESNIERLNSKLLKARSKLESDASAEERTRGIVCNLSTALQQLRTEVETAEAEKEKASKETSDVKVEIEKTERDIKSTQNKLMDKISELERVKASEAAALVNLKSLVEKMAKRRALASRNSSTICVSKWEYEYLSEKAELAMEVADKKVAAINAWIGTLKAQEKEMLLKSELIEKEIKAVRFAEEEEEVCGMGKVMAARNTVGEEANEFMEMLKAGMSSPRKLSGEDSLTATASRRGSKTRRVSGVQGMRSAARSPSFAIKKRMREAPSLAKLLRRRNGRVKQNEVDFDSYASCLLAHENDHSKQ